MCGITGIINFNSNYDISNLEQMTEILSHRGPDDTGYYSNSHVGFGFKRLSIIDLNAGNQPMKSDDKKIIIVFNGEIYNYQNLKSILINCGYSFKTKSDTEVIIYSYKKWGIDCINRFNGMFAFAIYDLEKQKVFLVRDRLGIKPLYYSIINKTVVFASEIKSIIKYPGFICNANIAAISSYLTFRYPQGTKTVFENIFRLAPGSVMEVQLNLIKTYQYWTIPFHAKKIDHGEQYYYKKIRELLTLSVKRRMISDVSLGAFLSGGVDSSIVVALMSQLSKEKVKAFSIGFHDDGYNEYVFSKKVANILKVEHYPLLLSKDHYFSLLPDMIRQKDAPLSIPHEIALYQMCKELKKYITVVLSGEGADELFGGYGRVQRSPMDYKKIKFVNKYFPFKFRKLLFSLLGGKESGKWHLINNHMNHFFSVYHWFPFEEKFSLFSEDVNDILENDKQDIEEWLADFEFIKDGDPYDRVLYLFEKRHLTCLLDRLDVMSMASGVEARVPFVDHELVEFVSTIPYYYKLKWKSFFHAFKSLFYNSFEASEKLDYSKAILRKYATELLPEDIAYRKKLGFPVPLDNWFNKEGVKTVKSILLDPVTINRGFYCKEKLEIFLNNKQDLNYDFWGKKVWMLMNVELWYREYIDR